MLTLCSSIVSFNLSGPKEASSSSSSSSSSTVAANGVVVKTEKPEPVDHSSEGEKKPEIGPSLKQAMEAEGFRGKTVLEKSVDKNAIISLLMVVLL